MSKRKTTAGGYKESSDGSDVEFVDNPEQALKRSKPAPYAPPRLTTASKPGLGAFQFPGSRSSSRHDSVPPRHMSVSSSNRPTPVPDSIRTVSRTPEVHVSLDPDPDPEPSSSASLAISNDTPRSVQTDRPVGPHKASNQRSTLALERQMNGMADTFERFTSANEQRHNATDTTLAQILEAVGRLASASNLTACQTQGLSPSSVLASNTKPDLSNPSPTPELVSVVSKVVAEARSRVGKKKGGADDNSCKEHAQTTFYRMLCIKASREIRPFFEDEYGEPDTLPAQFVDPDTRYCRPYPHWKSPLTKQVAWIPTFILRFKSTIPKDQSDLSNLLRNLSDEQIVILLNDGPFKSAQAAWRDLKKTDAEIEMMRSSARRYQRVDRKVTLRTVYIKQIASLEGPQWEYLTHSGFMSQDESDGEEGVLITKRPEYRAQWQSNLYDAIHVAEREKAKAKPGLCPRLPLRRVEVIKCPIPALEHGSGSGKVPVRIAMCGISKSWRQKSPVDFKKYAHLLNMKEIDKPDISSFLEQHPEPNLRKEVDDDQHSMGDAQINGGGDAAGVGAGGDEASHFCSWVGLDYDGDEESGAVLEMGHILSGNTSAGAIDKEAVLSSGYEDNIPIDPGLVTDNTCDTSDPSGHETRLLLTLNQDGLGAPNVAQIATTEGPAPMRGTQSLAQAAPGLPHANDHLSRPFPGADMPPPPPLNPNPTPATSGTASNAGSSVAKEKKARSSKRDSLVGVDNLTPDPLSGAPAPKRRGRPPGSKNKPKV